MKNQLSRRNLNDFQHVEIVHKCEDAVKAKAKERQLSGLINQSSSVVEKLPERENNRARDELGALAGVSGKTYEHAGKADTRTEAEYSAQALNDKSEAGINQNTAERNAGEVRPTNRKGFRR